MNNRKLTSTPQPIDELPSKKIRLGDNTLNNMVSPEKRLVSLSTSDYDALNGCIDFIDKSLFAWHFYHDPDNILLVTAPSRFGKTSIIKMLEKFFGIPITSSGVRVTNVIQKDEIFVEDLSNMSKYFKIFKTKKIFEMCHCSPPVNSCNKCKQWFYEHCGQHPVISIDFGYLGTKSLKHLWPSLNAVIRHAFQQHGYLVTKVNGKTVWSSTQDERMGCRHVSNFLKYYDDIEHDHFWFNANTTEEDKEVFLINGLPFLAECLSLHFKTEETGKGVILLIDEFDAFVCKMIFEEGEKEEIQKNIRQINWVIRDWTREILKSCRFVKKALLMACCAMGGILSLGANNVQIRSFLDSHSFSESFGFTEDEVKFLVDVYGEGNSNETKEQMLKDIDEWYNGYSVIKTGKKIFSSFSILNYLRSLSLRSYWKDKMGSNRLDGLLAETPFHHKVFRLLNCTERTTSIKIVENIQPEHILKLNELIIKRGNVSEELVDLYFQFLTDCGFFNVIKRENLSINIEVPNFEIDCRLRQKVLSGLLKKETGKFDSSKISAFIASLKSLADISVSLRDNSVEVAMCIAKLYTNTKIPRNHFEIQADLYFLIKDWIDECCYAELKVDSGNSPRIDIFFKINDNTSVVLEIKHFISAKSVDEALEQILDKKYYKVCSNCNITTENKILLGVFLASDGKISVGCLVNINEENSSEVIMKGRVCVDSEGNTLFPPNEETG
jgi:hypothetical protein